MSQSLTALYLSNPELANALRKQQAGQALMQQGMDSSPVQHWSQGLSRLAAALVGGYESGQADKEFKEAGEKRRAAQAEYMAPYMPGGGGPTAAPTTPTAPVLPVAQTPLAPPDLATVIAEEANKRGIPPNLATALFATESNFNPTARNPKSGAYGIGQVLPSTAASPGYGLQPITEADLSDPRKAIPWSLDYLNARAKAVGLTDWNDPQQRSRAWRSYGENTDDYVNKVESRAGQGVPVAGPGAPTGGMPRAAGSNDLGEAQYYEAQAMRAMQAGDHQSATILMQRAQRAQAAALARQPQPTEIERVAIAAGYPPGSFEYQQLMRDYAAKKGAGVNVTVNPNPPADHRAVYVDGRLSHYEVIPGSETARKVAEQQKKEGKREDATAKAGNLIVEDIDRVLKAVDSSILPAVGPGATTLSGFSGTAAHDVSKLLDGIKANIAFDKLQQMRESSPTGAALGAVSDREMALLQAVVGSLEQSQSGQQFKQNLQRLRTLTMDVIHGPGKWQEAPPAGETVPTTAPAGGDRPPLSSFAR